MELIGLTLRLWEIRYGSPYKKVSSIGGRGVALRECRNIIDMAVEEKEKGQGLLNSAELLGIFKGQCRASFDQRLNVSHESPVGGKGLGLRVHDERQLLTQI